MDPPPNANGTVVNIGCALTITAPDHFYCQGGDQHQPINGMTFTTNDAVYMYNEFFSRGPTGPQQGPGLAT